MAQNLEISISRNGDKLQADVCGMLDTASAAQFQEEISKLLEAESIDISMNLSGLEYISSQGIRCFLTLIKAVMAKNGKLVFRNIRPSVREILDISGISQAMTIE